MGKKRQKIQVIPVERELRLCLSPEDERGLKAGHIIPKSAYLGVTELTIKIYPEAKQRSI